MDISYVKNSQTFSSSFWLLYYDKFEDVIIFVATVSYLIFILYERQICGKFTGILNIQDLVLYNEKI